MKKYPYIVHINPHARPRDPVDVWTPTFEHLANTALLGVVYVMAVWVYLENITKNERKNP